MALIVAALVRAAAAHPGAAWFVGGIAVGMLLERVHVIISRREAR